jgi:hypothetical protein
VTKIKHQKIKIDSVTFGSGFTIIMTYNKPNTMESGNSALVGTIESFFADVLSRLLFFKFIGLNSQ